MAGVLWKKDLVSPGMKIIYVLVNGVQGECRPGDKRVQKGWEKLPSSSVWMPQIWQGESSIFQTRTINLSLSVHTVFSVFHQTSANDKCCFLKFLLGNQFWPSTVCLTSSTESSGAPLALFMMCWNWRAGRAVSVIYNEIINEVDHGALCFFLCKCINEKWSYCSFLLQWVAQVISSLLFTPNKSNKKILQAAGALKRLIFFHDILSFTGSGRAPSVGARFASWKLLLSSDILNDKKQASCHQPWRWTEITLATRAGVLTPDAMQAPQTARGLVFITSR